MLSTTDLNIIRGLIAGTTVEVNTATTDATPVTVWSYTLTTAEVLTVEVICRALTADGAAGFVRRVVASFLYDGTAVDSGAVTDVQAAEYLGTGLSTCNLSFSVAGAVVSLLWTGESAAITASFRVTAHNLTGEVVLP